MSNLFKELELEAFRSGVTPRTKESISWFRKKAQQMGRISENRIMRDEQIKLQKTIGPGSMVMFSYDPKFKNTLPYYDTFPLAIMVDKAPKGFYGLNLHYLPPLLRAKFLNELLEYTNNDKFNTRTRFQLSYELLQKVSGNNYFKPCFKHYLNKHVRSQFAVVKPKEWEIATFLPTANFQKSSKTEVYRKSRGML
jgi:hypothetical protein